MLFSPRKILLRRSRSVSFVSIFIGSFVRASLYSKVVLILIWMLDLKHLNSLFLHFGYLCKVYDEISLEFALW